MSNQQIELEEAKLPPLGPIIRKPVANKQPFNPLEGIDFDKVPSKEQAYLLGYINGQRNSRR